MRDSIVNISCCAVLWIVPYDPFSNGTAQVSALLVIIGFYCCQSYMRDMIKRSRSIHISCCVVLHPSTKACNSHILRSQTTKL